MSVRIPSVLFCFVIQGLAILLPFFSSLSAEPETYNLAEADATYQLALRYDEAGKNQEAISVYRQLVRKFPIAPSAEKAQWRLSQLLENQGQLHKAFEAYQKLITKYPDTSHFDDAVARQVMIANRFLAGYREGLFTYILVSPAERAAGMYQQLVDNAPFSKYAPIAQFNLGLANAKQGKPIEAIAAYQGVLDRYPQSNVCDDALYQIGYTWMRVGMSGQSQDLSAVQLAKNAFEDFLIQYPNSEKASQARENLNLIGSREAQDITKIAQFYERYRQLKSAVIYYNDVIRREPQTQHATAAQARIEKLRNDYGEDVLRAGPEKAETGEKMALRRRLQSQVEPSVLSNVAGPPRNEIVPDELPLQKPRMHTSIDDVQPLPAVEPPLPTP